VWPTRRITRWNGSKVVIMIGTPGPGSARRRRSHFSSSAKKRDTGFSVPPPALAGTMMRTGLAGHGSPSACAGAAASAAATTSEREAKRIAAARARAPPADVDPMCRGLPDPASPRF
jgi:hypothetical protein